MDIVSGKWAPGDRLPSVRVLAQEAAVNPNTMQRAYQELEDRGLLTTERTVGKFVTTDKEVIAVEKEKLARTIAHDYKVKIQQLGYTEAELSALLEQA